MSVTPPRFTKFAGFSLIELAVVLVIVGIMATFALGITGAFLSKQRHDTTRAKLAIVESAITLFVTQNKFLPCPAIGTLDGTLASPDARLGKEQVSLTSGVRTKCSLTVVPGTAWNQETGVVPWVTLGIPLADAQDGWGNMLTYRVEESMIAPDRMDFTMCTPAGSNTTVAAFPNMTCSTCTTATFPGACNAPGVVTAGRGLRVRSVSGTLVADPALSPSTGAAYVVISHGENQAGAYQYTGVLNAGNAASGTEELRNYANAGYAANSGTAYLVDDAPAYATATSHFDDLVLRPSILAVATKAQLGPRAY